MGEMMEMNEIMQRLWETRAHEARISNLAHGLQNG
jgi:hypothetical protein